MNHSPMVSLDEGPLFSDSAVVSGSGDGIYAAILAIIYQYIQGNNKSKPRSEQHSHVRRTTPNYVTSGGKKKTRSIQAGSYVDERI